jgi:aspartate aminotransferase
VSASARAVDEVTAQLAAFNGRPQPWLLGSPCFAPPEQLLTAIRTAAGQPHFHYAPQEGLQELRETIAQHHRKQGEEVTAEQVIVTNGAKCGLLAVLGSLLEPGDEVIHPTPCYPPYPVLCTLLGATPVSLPESDQGFGWQHADLQRVASRKTRLVLLSSPSNPSGATLTSDESETLVSFCHERGIFLVCDETYEAFRFGSSVERTPYRYDPEQTTVIRIRTFSKAFGLCGWRIGYVVASPAIIRRIAFFQSSALNPAGTLPQLALVHLPEVPARFGEEACAEVRERIIELHKIVTSLGLKGSVPEGGFYLWADVRHLLKSDSHATSRAWCSELARTQGLGFWPGEDFLGKGWVRIAAVSNPMPEWSQSVAELKQRLAAFLS